MLHISLKQVYTVLNPYNYSPMSVIQSGVDFPTFIIPFLRWYITKLG